MWVFTILVAFGGRGLGAAGAQAPVPPPPGTPEAAEMISSMRP
jgi:hypothetical protein